MSLRFMCFLLSIQICAYFRMRFIVSLRSFPWNGRDPVSISNWTHTHTQYINNLEDFYSRNIIDFSNFYKFSQLLLSMLIFSARFIYLFIYFNRTVSCRNKSNKTSVPLVPRMTTSQRCGCGPACSPPRGPCTPPSHRTSRPSSHGLWTPYTSRNLHEGVQR